MSKGLEGMSIDDKFMRMHSLLFELGCLQAATHEHHREFGDAWIKTLSSLSKKNFELDKELRVFRGEQESDVGFVVDIANFPFVEKISAQERADFMTLLENVASREDTLLTRAKDAESDRELVSDMLRRATKLHSDLQNQIFGLQAALERRDSQLDEAKALILKKDGVIADWKKTSEKVARNHKVMVEDLQATNRTLTKERNELVDERDALVAQLQAKEQELLKSREEVRLERTEKDRLSAEVVTTSVLLDESRVRLSDLMGEMEAIRASTSVGEKRVLNAAGEVQPAREYLRAFFRSVGGKAAVTRLVCGGLHQMLKRKCDEFRQYYPFTQHEFGIMPQTPEPDVDLDQCYWDERSGELIVEYGDCENKVEAGVTVINPTLSPKYPWSSSGASWPADIPRPIPVTPQRDEEESDDELSAGAETHGEAAPLEDFDAGISQLSPRNLQVNTDGSGSIGIPDNLDQMMVEHGVPPTGGVSHAGDDLHVSDYSEHDDLLS